MTNDAEYKAAEYIIKADKRFRSVLYLLLLALVFIFAVVAYKLWHIDDNVTTRVKGVISQQQKLVADAQADSRTRTEENRRYNTCLLILPIEQRDVDGQRYCYNLSDLPGGRTSAEFTPITVNPDAVATSTVATGAVGQSEDSSYPNTTSSSPAEQSDNSQSNPQPPVQSQPSNIQKVINGLSGAVNTTINFLGGLF